MSGPRSGAARRPDRAPKFSFQAISDAPPELLTGVTNYLQHQPGVRRTYLMWFWPSDTPALRRLLLCVDVDRDMVAIEEAVASLLCAQPTGKDVDVLTFDVSDDGTADFLRTVAKPFFQRDNS